MPIIRIATRNSPLALWQAHYVQALLQERHKDLKVKIVSMTTKGDQLLDRKLSQAGGKGLFLKELEQSLLVNETDIAVHSMKDVPVQIPDGLIMSAVCERDDPRDVLVSNKYQNLYALPKGARVGTSSMRRICQLKMAFPTLEFIELRGNVNTRLKKLDDGEYDAIVLAAAGLIRLGLDARISQSIAPELCLPAVGQGIIGVQCRADDIQTQELLKPIHDIESALYLAAERSMNLALGGGCHVPVAGFAEVAKGKIRMRGMVGEIDGSNCLFSNRISHSMSEKAAIELGQQVAEDLLEQGAAKILDSLYSASLQSEQPEKPVVVMTRQDNFMGNMGAILESFDYQVEHVPTFTVHPSGKKKDLTELEKLEDYSDVIFVSRNSVEMGMNVILKKGEIPDSVQVMAVGAETAKSLYKGYGVDALFPDSDVGAEALLRVRSLADLTNRNILIVGGDNGLQWPAEEMRKRGATVNQIVCYTHRKHRALDKRLENMLSKKNSTISSIFLHSAASAAQMVEALAPYLDRLKDTVMVVGSQRIARVAIDAGWAGQIRIADSPSNKHMLRVLLS